MREITKNALVGTFVLGGILLLSGIIFLLSPSVGDGKVTLNVRFSDIDRIVIGSKVYLVGQPIGSVSAISRVDDYRNKSVNEWGQVYPFLVTLKIDSGTTVFKTDSIYAHNIGLWGERTICIKPMPLKNGATERIAPEDHLWAITIPDLEDVMSGFGMLLPTSAEARRDGSSLLDDLSLFFGNMKKLSEKISESGIQNFLSNITEEISAELIDNKTIRNTGHLIRRLGEIAESINHVNATWEPHLTNKEIPETLMSVVNNLKVLSFSISDLVMKTSLGRNTLGKVLTTDELHSLVVKTIQNLDELIEAVKKFGVLFHSNKEWKNHLNKQESPSNKTGDLWLL